MDRRGIRPLRWGGGRAGGSRSARCGGNGGAGGVERHDDVAGADRAGFVDRADSHVATRGDGSSDEPTTTHPADPTAPTVPAPADPPPTEPPRVAAPPPAAPFRALALRLEPVADIDLATAMAHRDGDPALYVTTQDGKVWRLVAGAEPELVLDIGDVVSPYESGSERGLLGLAFDPADGRMFVYYTDARIDSHRRTRPRWGSRDRSIRVRNREVLFVEQPGLGHKGGGMAFAADGHLYVAMGDGGASSGRDAQDYELLLGAILRIDPRADGPGYDVPPDNPYVGQEGKRAELWAKGLRNPWGFSIDAATGDLWTADVGNHTMEEIDRAPTGVGGLNFGWYYVEGTEVMNRGAPADAVPPVYAYRHDEVGPAAIGGRVYRGAAIPDLAGAYLFADMSGPVFAIGASDETVRLDLSGRGIVSGFGTDASGEVYLLTLGAGVLKLVPG